MRSCLSRWSSGEARGVSTDVIFALPILATGVVFLAIAAGAGARPPPSMSAASPAAGKHSVHLRPVRAGSRAVVVDVTGTLPASPTLRVTVTTRRGRTDEYVKPVQDLRGAEAGPH